MLFFIYLLFLFIWFGDIPDYVQGIFIALYSESFLKGLGEAIMMLEIQPWSARLLDCKAIAPLIVLLLQPCLIFFFKFRVSINFIIIIFLIWGPHSSVKWSLLTLILGIAPGKSEGLHWYMDSNPGWLHARYYIPHTHNYYWFWPFIFCWKNKFYKILL